MSKTKFIITIAVILMLTGCCTKNNNGGFEDYVPWWVNKELPSSTVNENVDLENGEENALGQENKQ